MAYIFQIIVIFVEKIKNTKMKSKVLITLALSLLITVAYAQKID